MVRSKKNCACELGGMGSSFDLQTTLTKFYKVNDLYTGKIGHSTPFS